MSKKLFRSQNQKVIGGVCGGIAEYFNIDPVIVRIIFVVSIFGWGSSILVYILAMIIVPKNQIAFNNAYAPPFNPKSNTYEQNAEFNSENANYDWQQSNYNEPQETSNSKAKNFIGITLIGIGAMILLENYFDFLEFEFIFPSILIAIGFYILINRKS